MEEALGETVVSQWQLARSANIPWEPPMHKGELMLFKERYAMQELLGVGGFGTVHRAIHCSTGTEVAVKTICFAADEQSKSTQRIELEIQAMCKCSNPLIISVIEAFVPNLGVGDRKGEFVWQIVLELCSGRDLFQIIEERGALEPEALRAVTAQLAVAVLHMHSRGVVHRDLKPSNIMVLGGELQGALTNIQLIDFGIAHILGDSFVSKYEASLTKHKRTWMQKNRAIEKDDFQWPGADQHPDTAPRTWKQKLVEMEKLFSPMKSYQVSPCSTPSKTHFSATAKGTQGYSAPEVRPNPVNTQQNASNGFSTVEIPVSSDAFSIGVTIRQCATGVPPDEDLADYISMQTMSLPAVIMNLCRRCYGKPIAKFRFISQLPQEVRTIIKCLTETSVEKRMTITQLCQTSFVADAPGSYENPFGKSVTML